MHMWRFIERTCDEWRDDKDVWRGTRGVRGMGHGTRDVGREAGGGRRGAGDVWDRTALSVESRHRLPILSYIHAAAAATRKLSPPASQISSSSAPLYRTIVSDVSLNCHHLLRYLVAPRPPPSRILLSYRPTNLHPPPVVTIGRPFHQRPGFAPCEISPAMVNCDKPRARDFLRRCVRLNSYLT